MKIEIYLHRFKDGTLGDPGQFYISHLVFAPLGVNITMQAWNLVKSGRCSLKERQQLIPTYELRIHEGKEY